MVNAKHTEVTNKNVAVAVDNYTIKEAIMDEAEGALLMEMYHQVAYRALLTVASDDADRVAEGKFEFFSDPLV